MVYKNRVYLEECMPVEEEIDIPNLRFLTHHDENSNYLTDGKALIYIGERHSLSFDNKNGEAIAILGERMIKDVVDLPTLKVVSADVLIDKNNIYNGNSYGITVIPIKELGMEVIVLTE
jgi:hypothetical protein